VALDQEIPLVSLRPASGRRCTLPRPLRRAIGPVVLLALWLASSATGLLPATVLAAPREVMRRGVALTVTGELPGAIAVSAGRVAYGLVIGAIVGIGLALIAGLFRFGEDVVDASVGMLRTVPWVGLAPLFIIWFGIDERPKIALVALAVAFPLYVNLYAGIRGVDARLVEAGRVLGLSWLGLVLHVVLPGALPNALVGLRYAMGSAWLALVFAEQLNATQGIGYLMINAEQFLQTDVIVVCLLVYALLGLVSDLIVRAAGRLLLTWRASFEGA
jgi:sulfonate transport system permease protein